MSCTTSLYKKILIIFIQTFSNSLIQSLVDHEGTDELQKLLGVDKLIQSNSIYSPYYNLAKLKKDSLAFDIKISRIVNLTLNNK